MQKSSLLNCILHSGLGIENPFAQTTFEDHAFPAEKDRLKENKWYPCSVHFLYIFLNQPGVYIYTARSQDTNRTNTAHSGREKSTVQKNCRARHRKPEKKYWAKLSLQSAIYVPELFQRERSFGGCYKDYFLVKISCGSPL